MWWQLYAMSWRLAGAATIHVHICFHSLYMHALCQTCGASAILSELVPRPSKPGVTLQAWGLRGIPAGSAGFRMAQCTLRVGCRLLLQARG
jgi:hypothetical protein